MSRLTTNRCRGNKSSSKTSSGSRPNPLTRSRSVPIGSTTLSGSKLSLRSESTSPGYRKATGICSPISTRWPMSSSSCGRKLSVTNTSRAPVGARPRSIIRRSASTYRPSTEPMPSPLALSVATSPAVVGRHSPTPAYSRSCVHSPRTCGSSRNRSANSSVGKSGLTTRSVTAARCVYAGNAWSVRYAAENAASDAPNPSATIAASAMSAHRCRRRSDRATIQTAPATGPFTHIRASPSPLPVRFRRGASIPTSAAAMPYRRKSSALPAAATRAATPASTSTVPGEVASRSGPATATERAADTPTAP